MEMSKKGNLAVSSKKMAEKSEKKIRMVHILCLPSGTASRVLPNKEIMSNLMKK